MSHFTNLQIILYVSDQSKSTAFYTRLLQTEPTLNVPGMTEFQLAPNIKLGLMPNSGIVKILQDKTPHPELGNGIPRCELYLSVNDLEKEFENAVRCGSNLISEIKDRDWGDTVCYFSDQDGHIIAFAKKTV